MISRKFMSDPVQPVAALTVEVVAWTFAILLRLMRATWRLDTSQRLKLDQMLADGTPTIIVFWHGHMIPLLAALDGYSGVVISSKSFRGSVIGRITEIFGNVSLQVGHHGAVKKLQAALAGKPGLLAIAVDGPLGPYHHVKRGAVILSAMCAARIVPLSVQVGAAISLPRWDRMALPLPFAKVSVRVGQPMRFATSDLKKTDCATESVRVALEELEGC